ncbi:MAG: phosphotransacetylase [Lactobacillales bacterium]|jgi:phosphate butyryltransferase|nr:phosphotransacetylase [Lactobacillales bacterium]
MTNIAIPGGSKPELLSLVKEAKAKYGDQLHFFVFDHSENIDTENLWTYIPCKEEEVVSKAVACVANSEAQILLKGIVQTHTLLKEVLKSQYHLKERALLSHVAIVDIPKLGRPILLTDAGMNIAPDSVQLSMIITNALSVAKKIGIAHPKVALLSAAENYNPKMSSSVLAKEVTEHFEGNAKATIFGPLSLDLALSKESVAHKRFEGPIRGDADILVVPTIDVGNVFYKSLLLFGDTTMGGIIVGTKIPIVLTSRSDSIKNKLYALEFALQQLGEG